MPTQLDTANSPGTERLEVGLPQRQLRMLVPGDRSSESPAGLSPLHGRSASSLAEEASLPRPQPKPVPQGGLLGLAGAVPGRRLVWR